MISIFLASMLLAGTPLATEVQQTKIMTEQTASNSFEMGSFIVEKARADYNDGKYNEFLNKMDQDYLEAKANNGLEGLIELRKETAKVNIHPEFVRSQGMIQDAKNKNLLDVVENNDSAFAQKVRSAAASAPAESKLLNAYHYKAPDAEGLNADERTVVEIDLEYSYKALHLDTLAASDSIADKREKQMVLEMQRMDRLVKASETFQDKELKQAIAKSAVGIYQRLSKKYDMKDLHDLSNGKIKPQSPLEEKVGAIVGSAQGQIFELHRHLLNHLDSNEPIAETVQN